jgi:hypothetical protein
MCVYTMYRISKRLGIEELIAYTCCLASVKASEAWDKTLLDNSNQLDMAVDVVDQRFCDDCKRSS